MGSINPIEEVASDIFNDILQNKEAYEEDDKDEILNWSLSILDYFTFGLDVAERISGNAARISGQFLAIKKYTPMTVDWLISKHMIDPKLVSWKDLSKANSTKKWNGISELLGKPDSVIFDPCPLSSSEVRSFFFLIQTAVLLLLRPHQSRIRM